MLLRGNGSPRTFRLSLPALQKSLTTLGLLFSAALLATLVLLGLQLFRPASRERVDAPASPSTPTAEGEAKPAFWKSLTAGEGEKKEADDDLRKENQALRSDITRIAAQLDQRKDLSAGPMTGLLQFFGPRNVEEGVSPIAVKNIRVTPPAAGKTELTVDFELHNVDPEQRTARGYIVVLAKTPNYLSAYPSGAFAPSQNILLDYTRGETFAVARFREARASFKTQPLDGQRPTFQVLLFSNDGHVIANQHVENGGGS